MKRETLWAWLVGGAGRSRWTGAHSLPGDENHGGSDYHDGGDDYDDHSSSWKGNWKCLMNQWWWWWLWRSPSWKSELRTRCIVYLVLHAASEDNAGQGVGQLSPGDITFRYITCVDTKRSSKWWNRFMPTCYQVFEGSQVYCLLWDLQGWRGTLRAPRPLPHPSVKSCHQAKIA